MIIDKISTYLVEELNISEEKAYDIADHIVKMIIKEIEEMENNDGNN